MNIIFDIDDTLYNLRGPFEKAHESIFGDRIQASMEWLFQRSRIHSDAAFYQRARGEIHAREEFAYRIRMTYRELGIKASDQEIEHFEEIYRYHQKHISLFPGMEDLLTWLRTRGVRLGILTNGAHDKQWVKAQALDVFRWIPRDAVFISGDLPAPKPDPLAFRAVEKGMNLDRQETWYVGDNFYADMVGAKGAGWHSIWFNHRGQTPSTQDVKPDYEVTSFQDLKDLIYRLVQ